MGQWLMMMRMRRKAMVERNWKGKVLSRSCPLVSYTLMSILRTQLQANLVDAVLGQGQTRMQPIQVGGLVDLNLISALPGLYHLLTDERTTRHHVRNVAAHALLPHCYDARQIICLSRSIVLERAKGVTMN